jgi:hypothetical protein
MRSHVRVSTILMAIAMAGALAVAASAQQSGLPAAAKPKAYKPVAVKLPTPISDPTFESFRKQLSGIAERKDRAALARVVAKEFFWIPEDKDIADKSRPPIDTLTRALGLDSPDGTGWEIIGSFASDATGGFDPDRKGVLCSPAEPEYDIKAAEALAAATGTDFQDWVYPANDSVEVRADPAPGSRVVAKLGLHLIYPDDSPASAVATDSIRVVLPSGQMGFVSVESLLTLDGDQLCYVKGDDGWKIAGLRGGDITNK